MMAQESLVGTLEPSHIGGKETDDKIFATSNNLLYPRVGRLARAVEASS